MQRAILLLGSAAVVRASYNVDIAVTPTSGQPLPHFWRSCGLTPAEYLLRNDEQENMAWAGSAPLQGLHQVRTHYLLDLLIVTGWQQTNGTQWLLSYDFDVLFRALDVLYSNGLKVGFEIMGSPMGFPQLPISFAVPSSGNGQISPNTTLALFRVLVRDVILAMADRYGNAAVEDINWESHNEPECGWGWQLIQPNLTIPTYALYWQATEAGVSDAEAARGLKLRFGGPATCRGVSSDFVQFVIQHYVSGTNVYTGLPGRLDFISAHYKGGGSTAGTILGDFSMFDWLRATQSNKTWSVPYTNDEADPLVGWAVPEAWRADSRYASMVARSVLQHFLLQVDNTTGANPLLLVSFDNAFLNADGYTGFQQRTLTARFNGPPPPGGGVQPFALIPKPSLAIQQLMSKLGDARCGVSGGATAADVLYAPVGVVCGSWSAGDYGVGILVYNSNDTTVGDDSTTASISLTVNGGYFTPGSSVTVVHYRLDQVNGNPSSVWDAQGQPQVPSPQQLLAMWSASGVPQLTPPQQVQVSSTGGLQLPAFDLPLPGVSLLHIAAAQPAPPPTPVGVWAAAKPAAWSLLSSGSGGALQEVLVRWNCTAVSPVTATFNVQFGSSGTGPWADAGASTGSAPFFACVYLHAAPMPSQQGALWYRVSATDYWGTNSTWSSPVQAQLLSA